MNRQMDGQTETESQSLTFLFCPRPRSTQESNDINLQDWWIEDTRCI